MSSPGFNSSLYLAIDQGGQSSRVAIYDGHGQQLFCFNSPCATHTSLAADGTTHVEQNAEEILAGIRQGLMHLEKTLGGDLKYVKAAGFAGQGSSLVCWHNGDGSALSPVLSWQDRRAQSVIDGLRVSQQQVRKSTGLRLSPHYGASKIRWCLDNLPEVRRAHETGAARIGPIASYLFRHLLSADNADQQLVSRIDPGHAQRTLLWNLETNNWDPELLSAFGIDAMLLPECVWHNSHFGNLIINGHSIPLHSCQRDQGASLFARGAPDPAVCYVNIGTGAFIQRVSGQLVAPEGLLVSPLWIPDPTTSAQKLYAWEATVNGAAAALDWLAQETGFSEVSPPLIERALQFEPTRPIYLLNAVGGLSAPYWRTDLVSSFSAALAPDEKILAWIESVIFQIAINVALMQTTSSLSKIFISGGLSRADGVCQKLADITGLGVCRSENADATLQGVAYTAAGQPEHWQGNAQDKTFIATDNACLQERFTVWQQAMNDWLLE